MGTKMINVKNEQTLCSNLKPWTTGMIRCITTHGCRRNLHDMHVAFFLIFSDIPLVNSMICWFLLVIRTYKFRESTIDKTLYNYNR